MSQKLHQLIQSLSKSEKRYFKLYAQRFSDKEGSLKMVIFDNISKQDSYNEELLYKKLAPKLTKNRYAVEKVHLYQMIWTAYGPIMPILLWKWSCSKHCKPFVFFG